MKLIRDAQSTKNSDRIVLNALALRADPRKRHSCYPGQALLVADTQLELKTVRRALKRLEAAKLVAIKKRYNDSSIYFINVALLQRQADANKVDKDAIPECPFDEPTIEQEHQLDADEAKVIFDEGPAAAPASDEHPEAPDTMPVSAAIQALNYVNEKMSSKQADTMASSLMKSHGEDEILQAIASFDEYALREVYKAENPIAYLRKSINNALSKDKCGDRTYDLDEVRSCIQKIVDDDVPSENQWVIPTTWNGDDVARFAADIAELSGGTIRVRGPFAINWEDGLFGESYDRAVYDRYIVLVKPQNKTVEGELTLEAHG